MTSSDLYHACCHSLMTSPKTSGASCCGKRGSAPCSCSSLCLRTHKGRSNMHHSHLTTSHIIHISPHHTSRIIHISPPTSHHITHHTSHILHISPHHTSHIIHHSHLTTSHITHHSHLTTSHSEEVHGPGAMRSNTHQTTKNEEHTKKKFLGRVLGPDGGTPGWRNTKSHHITHHTFTSHHITHHKPKERKSTNFIVKTPLRTIPDQRKVRELPPKMNIQEVEDPKGRKSTSFIMKTPLRTIRDQRKLRELPRKIKT